MAAVLDIDSSLNLPDFRAMEKAYQELSSIIDLVETVRRSTDTDEVLRYPSF